jgi:hypothetical protein
LLRADAEEIVKAASDLLQAVLIGQGSSGTPTSTRTPRSSKSRTDGSTTSGSPDLEADPPTHPGSANRREPSRGGTTAATPGRGPGGADTSTATASRFGPRLRDASTSRLDHRPRHSGAPAPTDPVDLPGEPGRPSWGGIVRVRQALVIPVEQADRVIDNQQQAGPVPLLLGTSGSGRVTRHESLGLHPLAACGRALAEPSLLHYSPAPRPFEAAESRRLSRAVATSGLVRNRSGIGSGGDQAR